MVKYAKQKKRGQRTRIRKGIILLGVEGNKGNKTERNYFLSFNHYITHYSIILASGNYTDPLNIVMNIIKEKKKMDWDVTKDKAYLIIDADYDRLKHQQIIDALALAKKNSIIPILSNPCIEIWFMLHFDYSTHVYETYEEVANSLKNHIDYAKNRNFFDILFPHTTEAIANGKRLEKYHNQVNHDIYDYDCSPMTQVHCLVEMLMNDIEKQ